MSLRSKFHKLFALAHAGPAFALLPNYFLLRKYPESVRTQKPVDAGGAPVPWYTYPAIDYLSRLDYSAKRIFEYGCGMSTLFWGARAAEVISVEDGREWYDAMREKAASRILLAEDKQGYLSAIEQKGLFDVIVIDGSHRNACVPYALSALAEGGLIIADNTDWFPNVTAALRAAGLIQVDFHGLGPCNRYAWVTSIFLRRDFNVIPRENDLPGWTVGGIQQCRDHEG